MIYLRLFESAAAFLGRRGFAGAVLAGLVALLFMTPVADAQVSGVSYTFSPVGEYAFFESDDESGLENSLLYGGALGFGFGRNLEVSAVYLRRNDIGNRFGEGSDNLEIDALQGIADDRTVNLQRYGGRVRLNLASYADGTGGFVPFVSAGAGILHFDPEGVDESESIYVTGGAGLTFSALGRYTITVAGQGLGYRYNPATTFFLPSELDGLTTEQQDVFAPSVRAALQLYLGGRNRREDDALDRLGISRGGGTRFFVKPFYGRIEFADELKGGGGQFYRDQNVAGINAGVELGSYVGLQAFYWRGASGRDDVFDDFASDFEPIAFYGGELNLRFASQAFGGSGLAPYGIIGGGYADALSDYSQEIEGGVGTPDDRYFATLGGGLEFPITNSVKLHGNVRSLFMSTQEAEDVSDPDQVHANLMYSAGLKFSLGGNRSSSAEEFEQRAQERERLLREENQSNLDAREAALLAELRRQQARIDQLERREELAARGLSEEQIDAVMEMDGDPIADRPVREEPEPLPQAREQEQATGQQETPRANSSTNSTAGLSGRVIELPVPEVGEIYVRIGERGEGQADVETSYAPPTVVTSQGEAVRQQGGASGALSREEISTIIREELGQAREEQALSRDEISSIVEQAVQQRLAAARTADTDVAARNEQIRRLEAQIDDLRDDLRDELGYFEDRQLRREQRAGSRQRVVVEEGENGEQRVVEVEQRGYEASRLTPMAGFSYGGGGRFLIGVRGDYSGGYRGLSRVGFRFMPEAAIGIGDGVGINLLANAVYDFDGDFVNEYLPGNDFAPYAGVGTGITTETGLGINLLTGLNYTTSQGDLFLELSTVNLFDYNRVLIGYRIRF